MVCLECGKNIENNNKQFCNRVCGNRHKAQRIDHSIVNPATWYTVTCVTCVTIFKTRNPQRKYCSSRCSAILNNHLRKKKPAPLCLHCGLPLPKKSAKYCGVGCQASYAKNNLRKKWLAGESSLTGKPFSDARWVKLFLTEIYGPCCQVCGWSGVNPITQRSTVQLEHMDGNCENNAITNVKLLCPNCHSLTPTYGILNKGSGRRLRLGKR